MNYLQIHFIPIKVEFIHRGEYFFSFGNIMSQRKEMGEP